MFLKNQNYFLGTKNTTFQTETIKKIIKKLKMQKVVVIIFPDSSTFAINELTDFNVRTVLSGLKGRLTKNNSDVFAIKLMFSLMFLYLHFKNDRCFSNNIKLTQSRIKTFDNRFQVT